MSNSEAQSTGINVITAIGNPDIEAEISRTLYNSGNDIRLRAISCDQVIQYCSNEVDVNERWVLVASKDLLGFGQRELMALQSDSLTCVILDPDHLPKTAEAINALVLTQIRTPLLHRPNFPQRRLVNAIGVTGTAGAPGRTMLALNLAQELSESEPISLIDSDRNNASVLFELGLHEVSWREEKRFNLSPSFHILTETNFSLTDIEPQRRYVIDIGSIEKINEIMTDRRLEGRQQAQWLESCATLLYVVKADDCSLAQLEKFLSERRNLPARQELIFVLNQVGNSRWYRAHEKIFKERAPGAKFIIPLDHAVTARARTHHTTLKEVAPRSSLRRSIAEIARHISS